MKIVPVLALGAVLALAACGGSSPARTATKPALTNWWYNDQPWAVVEYQTTTTGPMPNLGLEGSGVNGQPGQDGTVYVPATPVMPADVPVSGITCVVHRGPDTWTVWGYYVASPRRAPRVAARSLRDPGPRLLPRIQRRLSE